MTEGEPRLIRLASQAPSRSESKGKACIHPFPLVVRTFIKGRAGKEKGEGVQGLKGRGKVWRMSGRSEGKEEGGEGKRGGLAGRKTAEGELRASAGGTAPVFSCQRGGLLL